MEVDQRPWIKTIFLDLGEVSTSVLVPRSVTIEYLFLVDPHTL